MALSAAAERMPTWETFFCSTFAEYYGIPPPPRKVDAAILQMSKRAVNFSFARNLRVLHNPKCQRRHVQTQWWELSVPPPIPLRLNRPRIRASASALTEWHLPVKHGRATERQTAESLRWCASKSYIFPAAVIFRKGVSLCREKLTLSLIQLASSMSMSGCRCPAIVWWKESHLLKETALQDYLEYNQVMIYGKCHLVCLILGWTVPLCWKMPLL